LTNVLRYHTCRSSLLEDRKLPITVLKWDADGSDILLVMVVVVEILPVSLVPNDTLLTPLRSPESITVWEPTMEQKRDFDLLYEACEQSGVVTDTVAVL
jgi:hypothetical protein